MHISCKLTHTILRYIEQSGEETSSLLECIEVPEEFLRDPSYWIRADELEQFLTHVLRRSWSQPSGQILSTIAQSCVESRSWGVLDSVMRMMSSPAEVFSQPERFLSYFVAPAPPVDRQVRSESGIAFDLPISSEQYPLVSKFMAASFEAIPVFMGRPAAHCEWEGIRLSLNWHVPQQEIFESGGVGRQLSPELARDLLQNLRPAIAAQNLEASVMARTKPEHLPLLQGSSTAAGGASSNSKPISSWSDFSSEELAQLRSALGEEVRPEYDRLRHHIARLSDYMIRAQQIITLMASAKKISPDIREAMRRVDWNIVQEQFPATVEECYQIFRQHRSTSQSMPQPLSSSVSLSAMPRSASLISVPKEDSRV